MNHDEMIAVIQAHKEGKAIEYRGPISFWINMGPFPQFNFYEHEYRIKPEPPKPREGWVHCDDIRQSPGLLRKSEWLHVREVLP